MVGGTAPPPPSFSIPLDVPDRVKQSEKTNKQTNKQKKTRGPRNLMCLTSRTTIENIMNIFPQTNLRHLYQMTLKSPGSNPFCSLINHIRFIGHFEKTSPNYPQMILNTTRSKVPHALVTKVHSMTPK